MTPSSPLLFLSLFTLMAADKYRVASLPVLVYEDAYPNKGFTKQLWTALLPKRQPSIQIEIFFTGVCLTVNYGPE